MDSSTTVKASLSRPGGALPWEPQRHAGAIVALTAALLAGLAVLFIDLSSAARAYVGGESLWSKGQKSAVLALIDYAHDPREASWQAYREAIAVPLGDRRARLALERPTLDRAEVRRGFLAGGLDADDIAGMTRLYRWGRHTAPIARAIEVWAEADGLIMALDRQASALRQAGQAEWPLPQRLALLETIVELDRQLTPLEERFSAVLGEANRTARDLLRLGMVAGASVLSLVVWIWLRRAQRLADGRAAALRASEARRERTLRGSSDGYFEWDRRRNQLFVSHRFDELLGHAPGTLEPDPALLGSLQHPQEAAAWAAALQAGLEHGTPCDRDLRLRHRDGGWRWFRVRAAIDRGPDGDDEFWSGSIADITAQREAQQALRQREVLFRSLWETTTDGVLVVDAEHRIRFANPAIRTLFGHDPAELLMQPLARLQPERLRQAHRQGVERYLQTGQRQVDWRGTELVGLHRDGHELPLEVSFSDFDLDGGRHFVGFLRDITRRKEAERELSQANERLEARVTERTRELSAANARLVELDALKSEFVATMSHELRTPLNAVLGFTSLLLSGKPGPLSAEQARQLGLVESSGQHLLTLINEVLDLSRIESGHMSLTSERFDLAELVREVVSQFQPAAAAKGIGLGTVAPGPIWLENDRRRTYQVLLNLAGNAIKFTPRGEVLLFAHDADADGVEFGAQDTGIGIAADQLDQLFQPFHQIDSSLGRAHEGSGLGLHLSRRLVELMGGRIEVRSEAGRGSRFSVWLPSAPRRRAIT